MPAGAPVTSHLGEPYDSVNPPNGSMKARILCPLTDRFAVATCNVRLSL